jgi:hypothetical protein
MLKLLKRMFQKKKVYKDISVLFDELVEKMIIIEKANADLDSNLTNEYTGRARNLMILIDFDETNNYNSYEKIRLFHLADCWKYVTKNTLPGPDGEKVRDLVHKVIIGIYAGSEGRMLEHNIVDVYEKFKKLEEKFPEALKLLLKLN